MSKKHWIALAIAGALAVPATVMAGYSSTWGVTINSDYAYGSIVGTRNSSDNVQYLRCSTTPSYGICYARDASGTTLSCYTYDAEMRATIRSVRAISWVRFDRASDGTCSYLTVSSGSTYME